MDWVILACYVLALGFSKDRTLVLAASMPLFVSMVLPAQLFIGAALVFTFAAFSVLNMMVAIFAIHSGKKWLAVTLLDMAIYCLIFAIDSWVYSHAETWIWANHEVIIFILHAFILLSLNRRLCDAVDCCADTCSRYLFRIESRTASSSRVARRIRKKEVKG